VPSNPTAAVIEPAVVREGSQHSSKIRVHGSAPDYYINGVNIGADPNHYGAFTIIPSAVVQDMRLHPGGTSVSHGMPAALELTTKEAFGERLSGEASLSPLEATGAVSIGSDRAFALASLRKSVLDKLVNRFDIHSDRRTLPPTNFQDVFLSTGLRLNESQTVVLDQYFVQDFLSYSTLESPSNAGGVDIFQHTKDSYLGLRYRWQLPSAQLKARLSGRWSKEIYRASPGAGQSGGFNLDLSEHRRTFSAVVEADIELPSDRVLVMGAEGDYNAGRDLKMQQTNWNFLPPDASSDLPHPYQPELNELYDNVAVGTSSSSGAIWSSLAMGLGRIDIEPGIRVDLFSDLEQSTAWSPRLKATLPLGNEQTMELALGGYAESPVSRLLQPYQVLIRHHAQNLRPVRSWMATAACQWQGIRISGFAKEISNQPVVTPNYTKVTDDNVVEPGFLDMASGGRSAFIGGDLTFELKHPGEWPITVYGFYGYSHATRRTAGVSVPHELDAPHRFFLQLGYQASSRLNLGADLAVRSGYPYSSQQLTSADNRYSGDWWQAQLATQNDRRFPAHISLNLHGELTFGDLRLNLNVANATDHGNPMINTSDGYIYDAGILPSLGLSYQF
jgi:hypothetical protein